MSEFKSERRSNFELPREPAQFTEEKSIAHSAQTINIDAGDNFSPPTMALDAHEPEPE